MTGEDVTEESGKKDERVVDASHDDLGLGEGLAEKVKKSGGGVKCPICKSPVTQASETFPFCCERCRLIDLGKWISGDYKISRPVEEADLDQGD